MTDVGAVLDHGHGLLHAADDRDHRGPRIVEPIGDEPGRAESADEHRHPLLQDDLDLGLGVGAERHPLLRRRSPRRGRLDAELRRYPFRRRPMLLGDQRRHLTDRRPTLVDASRKDQIDPEGTIGQLPGAPNHGPDLVGRHRGAAQHPEATCVGHRGHELRPGDRAHAGRDDGHLDPELVTKRRANR